jgi:multiple sugar transport system permease protein
VSAGVPTELIRGDIYYWQALMAATAIVGIPLAIVCMGSCSIGWSKAFR